MTTNLVHYHHPDDDQFSLSFVNTDRGQIDEKLNRYDSEIETRVHSYDLNEEVYVIYTKTNKVTDTDAVQYGFDTAFAEMSPDTRVIVRYFLDVFDSIREKNRGEESVPLDAYKSVDIEQVPDALKQVDWSGTIPQVGGQLASNLVLCHALPNANHRTSFSMFEGYVKATAGPKFELPSMTTDDYEWQTWVDDFIVDSKRLLTVRRNVGQFRYLSNFGCRTVRRNGGINISLDEYDLEMRTHEALSEYATRHEQRTVTFAEKLLKKTDDNRLVEEIGLTRSEFAEYIRQKI